MRCLAILFLMLTGAAYAVDEPSPLLHYTCTYGRSPWRAGSVVILPDGATRVRIEPRQGAAIDYATTLSEAERAALRIRALSCAFFDAPPTAAAPSPLHRDQHEQLRLSFDGRTGERSDSDTAPLAPLIEFPRRLLAQAQAVHAVETDSDIHAALTAVCPALAGTRLLQPDRLKTPLLTYLTTHPNDRQRVEWVLTALAHLTTPEEFSGVVALQMEREPNRTRMLETVGSHPFTGNIPPSHLDALCPLYLAFARTYGRQPAAALTPVESHALPQFVAQLGERRHLAALPLLHEWFDASPEPYASARLSPLAHMGQSSLNILIPYLSSTNTAHRLKSIELLTITSRLNPRAEFSNPLPAADYHALCPTFSNNVLPQLRQLAEQDPSPAVRRQAGEAAAEISRRIAQ